MNDLSVVADLYVDAAKRSLDATKATLKRERRSESYGVFRALEALVGMNEACLLIEQAVASARETIGVGHVQYDVDALLYTFWKLDRPRQRSAN